MRKIIIPIITLIITLTSCVKDEFNIDDYEKKLVVDGWIETGKYANVILIYTVPYFGESDLDTNIIYNFINTRAKVTIIADDNFNGVFDTTDNREVLTLTVDRKYYPPYIYKGYSIEGEAGKTYALIVEQKSEELKIVAQTTIPELPQIDSSWFSLTNPNDTMGIIWTKLTDDGSKANYYRITFNEDDVKSKYEAALYPNYTDDYFNGKSVDIPIYKPIDKLNPNQNLFKINETVNIKISGIDKATYEFWHSYYLENFNAFNPFADSKTKIKSNINNEKAFGLWAGYASVTTSVETTTK